MTDGPFWQTAFSTCASYGTASAEDPELRPYGDYPYTSNMTTEFWNEQYSGDDLAYGEAPNDFLSSMAYRLPTFGYALDIGAGEDPNAVFLAKLAKADSASLAHSS